MASKRARIPPSQKVAERLSLLIEYHSRSKSELARGVGVSPAAVTQWTKGETAITPTNGRAIADFLGEDYDFVMGLSDKGSDGLGAVLAAMGAERLRLLADIPPSRLAAFLRHLDSFLKDESDSDSTT